MSDYTLGVSHFPEIVKVCALGNLEMLLQKIKSGDDFRFHDDWPAREAAYRGKHLILEILLDKGVHTHAANGSLLKLSCSEGHINNVQLLIKRKFNISLNDYEAYRWAIAKERKLVVSYLEPLVRQKQFFDKQLMEKS